VVANPENNMRESKSLSICILTLCSMAVYEDVTLVTIQARSLNLYQVDQVFVRAKRTTFMMLLQNEANPLADTLGAIGGNMGERAMRMYVV
jgi:hypothetical protein